MGCIKWCFFFEIRRLDPWYVAQNNSNGCVFTHLKPYYHISKIDEITIFHILAIFGFWPIFSLFFNHFLATLKNMLKIGQKPKMTKMWKIVISSIYEIW